MAEYVCADGRMSVNGICSVVNQNNDNNNIIPTKTFDQKYESIEDIPTKDYSKDVKSTFEWDFDKVGNKIQNFGTTVKDNINAYDKYVEDNLGISKNVSTGFRTISTGLGIAKYGALGAVAPFVIPFVVGGALNNQAVKEQEAAINREETRDLQGRIDKGDFGSNTPTPQDKGRTDKGVNGSGSSSDGSKGSRGAGMSGFGGGADRF